MSGAAKWQKNVLLITPTTPIFACCSQKGQYTGQKLHVLEFAATPFVSGLTRELWENSHAHDTVLPFIKSAHMLI